MASTRIKSVEYIDSHKAYDNPYWQSSVIPYRIDSKGLEILMITSRRRKRWILPKGIVEPDMTPEDSAAKEALEEAGVSGKVVSKKLGRYYYKKWGGTCKCDVFAMPVDKIHSDWIEKDERDRKWLSADEAIKRLRHKGLRTIVKRFVAKKTH